MDWEYPLAFEVNADVFGLSVSHELPDELGAPAATKTNVNQSQISDMLPGSMYSKEGRSQFSQTVMKSMKSQEN